ncbi:3-oxoadipate enol-lactonase [Labrys monachus]|uniref:3-oxoadipate enol-lactonase n=1 Tax=Labrys monachus TaxID=217067 RepID=A0ABU0FAE9_9HYPH|nr:3-oxoadipate enol-lactonase [Labrys monachus]MDQ0391600.1 3-oxoadipate enol-lactonase [Labrys monachus]
MPDLIHINGIDTAYALEGPSAAPVVVLANGLGADLSMWANQLAVLATSFRVLRYDMRGHGGTGATPGDYSLDLLAGDLLALLDGLSIARAHLVGASLGGMVGQFLAVHHADRLESLALVATSSEAPRKAWQERVREVRRDGVEPQVEPTIDRWFTPAFRAAHPDLMASMRRMVLRTSRDGYAGCAAAIRDMVLSPVIGRIRVPTLVVAGAADLSTPLPMLEHIAGTIPDARLVAIEEAAHMPPLERPEECNAAIESFLRGLDAGPAAGLRQMASRLRG